jgi:hypothetical protein
MTTRHDQGQQLVRLTSQLIRGDHIVLDGLGGFAVLGSQPFGTKALIRLATGNLAVITERHTRWTAITPGAPIYLHGYQPCPECNGKGLIFATTDHGEPAWDNHRNRWVTH